MDYTRSPHSCHFLPHLYTRRLSVAHVPTDAGHTFTTLVWFSPHYAFPGSLTQLYGFVTHGFLPGSCQPHVCALLTIEHSWFISRCWTHLRRSTAHTTHTTLTLHAQHCVVDHTRLDFYCLPGWDTATVRFTYLTYAVPALPLPPRATALALLLTHSRHLFASYTFTYLSYTTGFTTPSRFTTHGRYVALPVSRTLRFLTFSLDWFYGLPTWLRVLVPPVARSRYCLTFCVCGTTPASLHTDHCVCSWTRFVLVLPDHRSLKTPSCAHDGHTVLHTWTVPFTFFHYVLLTLLPTRSSGCDTAHTTFTRYAHVSASLPPRTYWDTYATVCLVFFLLQVIRLVCISFIHTVLVPLQFSAPPPLVYSSACSLGRHVAARTRTGHHLRTVYSTFCLPHCLHRTFPLYLRLRLRFWFTPGLLDRACWFFRTCGSGLYGSTTGPHRCLPLHRHSHRRLLAADQTFCGFLHAV